MKEVKSLGNMIAMEKEKLKNLNMKLSEQKEIVPALLQELELKEEILKQDLRGKMRVCKNNTDIILMNRTKELMNLKELNQKEIGVFNLSSEIYEKRYFTLCEKLESLKIQTEKDLSPLKNKLNGMKIICKKMEVITDSLKSINHVDMEVTFQYILREMFANGLDFSNKDYDFFINKLQTK